MNLMEPNFKCFSIISCSCNPIKYLKLFQLMIDVNYDVMMMKDEIWRNVFHTVLVYKSYFPNKILLYLNLKSN